MLQFDRDGNASREQFEVFAAALGEGLAPVKVEPTAKHPFSAAIDLQKVGDLPVACVTGSGYRVTRSKADVARSSVHACFVQFRLRGDAHITNGDANAAVTAGDIFLLDPNQPFELGLDRPFRDLVIKLPERWINARFAQPNRLAGRVVPRKNPLGRLLTEYVAAACHSARHLSSSGQAMFAQHVLDLLAEAVDGLEQDAPRPIAAHRAALVAYARRLIALHSSDPNLRPEDIARATGVTTRTLHRIFAQHGETVMKAVLAERVQRAAKLLSSPQARHRTITEIAFACGFNDLTHFGRVFEAHMHATPSAWRRKLDKH